MPYGHAAFTRRRDGNTLGVDLESGESGTPADPASLPRPALWPEPPAGQAPVPIRGKDEENAEARAHVRAAYVGIGLMVLGLVLLAVAAIVRSWLPAVLGLAAGAAGAVVAVRSRVMDAATVGEEVRGD
jgi:hypothetical protein